MMSWYFLVLDLVIEPFNKGGDESIDIPSTIDLPVIPTIPKYMTSY